MYFIIAAIIISVACAVITIRTLVGYSDFKFIKKILISFFIIYGWSVPFIVTWIRKLNLMSVESYTTFSNISYFIFGFCFILFSFLIIRDIVWYAIYGFLKLIKQSSWYLHPKNIDLLNKANLIVFILALIASGDSIYQGAKSPEIKDVTIHSSKIKEDISIIQLSDLHISRTTSPEEITRLVDRVNAFKPDIIAMTGDVIDDKVDMLPEQMKALQRLRSKYGIYVSFGNHELYNGIASWQKKFTEMGFKLLFNKGLVIKGTNIYLAGIPDSHTASMSSFLNVDFYKALKGSKKSEYKVLMSHTPDFVEYLSHEIIDLQLSGHTHGGQIFPFHFIVKQSNGYLSGLYKVRGLLMYVSKGTGSWGPKMRLLAPSEITLISLQPEKNR